ncbi:MAG: hypothetical protein PHG05_03375 [Candidatus Nanoarchaeia archaeon]|nr:hypothetical protein [Candidatus Nanoarchaeia archaeon]
MKSIVFDSSTIISIATNNLLKTLLRLKEKFNGQFYIPEGAKEEIILKPLSSRRFKLEAMQVLSEVGSGVIEIYSNPRVKERAKQLLDRANNLIKARGNWVTIVDETDMEALALAEYLNADALAVDERTIRLLVEDPPAIANLFENKLHTKVEVNQNNLNFFKDELKKVKIVRSTELMTVAFELGILDEYTTSDELNIVKIDLRKNLLEGLLWGLKLNGCAISEDEINDIIKSSLK